MDRTTISGRLAMLIGKVTSGSAEDCIGLPGIVLVSEALPSGDFATLCTWLDRNVEAVTTLSRLSFRCAAVSSAIDDEAIDRGDPFTMVIVTDSTPPATIVGEQMSVRRVARPR